MQGQGLNLQNQGQGLNMQGQGWDQRLGSKAIYKYFSQTKEYKKAQPNHDEIMMLASFWYNTGMWQTDGQTDGHIALAKTRASIASRK